jgi:hypothetical protein
LAEFFVPTAVKDVGLLGVFVPAEVGDVTDPVAALSVFCVFLWFSIS